jgi:hypothetical protein
MDMGNERYGQPDDGLNCPECGTLTDDGQTCGECISELAEHYVPDDDVEPSALSDTMRIQFDQGGEG